MRIGILYHRFLSENGDERLIGGIQTYIYNLAKICNENNWEPYIFQCSNIPFTKVIDEIKIVGVKAKRKSTFKNISLLYKEASRILDLDKDVIIFGADHCSIKTTNKRCISIQHGISWDMPIHLLRPKALFVDTQLGGMLWKAKVRRDMLKQFDNCINRVCVDYNYLNWHRAMIPGKVSGNVSVIHNFSSIATDMLINNEIIKSERIKILFARRFTKYRGTRIVVPAVIKILKEYDNVEFTFAGEGPEEMWLKKKLGNFNAVKFIKYMPAETKKILSKHHISLVPSLASEGTSLSVAEAMSVGSVVVATSVGGITNMIIDGYNGVLISPKSENIYTAIKYLLDNTGSRMEISKHGYETAKSCYGLDNWKRKWINVIKNICQDI